MSNAPLLQQKIRPLSDSSQRKRWEYQKGFAQEWDSADALNKNKLSAKVSIEESLVDMHSLVSLEMPRGRFEARKLQNVLSV